VLGIMGTGMRGKSKVNWVTDLYLQWFVSDVIVVASGCDVYKLTDPLNQINTKDQYMYWLYWFNW
jgi:hypothetical protein